jgi:hypothetical protein
LVALTAEEDASVGTAATQEIRGKSATRCGMGKTYPEITEQSGGDPAVPGLNRCQLYVRENGSGKTELRARFNTGAIQVIATE